MLEYWNIKYSIGTQTKYLNFFFKKMHDYTYKMSVYFLMKVVFYAALLAANSLFSLH